MFSCRHGVVVNCQIVEPECGSVPRKVASRVVYWPGCMCASVGVFLRWNVNLKLNGPDGAPPPHVATNTVARCDVTPFGPSCCLRRRRTWIIAPGQRIADRPIGPPPAARRPTRHRRWRRSPWCQRCRPAHRRLSAASSPRPDTSRPSRPRRRVSSPDRPRRRR